MYSTCIGLLLSATDGQYVESPSYVEEEEVDIPVYNTADDTTDDEEIYEDEYEEDVEETEEDDVPTQDTDTKTTSTPSTPKVRKAPSDRPSFIKTLKEKTEKKIEDVSTRTNKAILDFLQKLGD